MEHDHPLRGGLIGGYGQRAANFTVQNSDLVLSLGCRLTFNTVGYESHLFAREAKKIVVDIDEAQLKNCHIKIDVPVRADVKYFLEEFLQQIAGQNISINPDWADKVRHWRSIFPPVTDEMRQEKGHVSSYYFYEILSEEMKKDQYLVWDQGASYYCCGAAFKVKKDQIVFSTEGFTTMGYGLPASIGVCFAQNRKTTVCVHGDGGLQMCVHELQTIFHNRLPIKLFVFSNQGYTSIKHTQMQYFDGHFVGVDPSSGLSCPDTVKLAEGYGLPALRINDHSNMREIIRKALDMEGPVVVDVVLDPLQPIQPRVKSERLPDGRMVSKPLEDMWPYLDREIFRREMIVKPLEE